MTASTPQPGRPDTIVLIHGLWMTALSWEHWVDRYQYRGYNVIAKSWPGMDGDVDELRKDPSGIEHLGIEEIVDHYAGIIAELDSPPIIMGHSFGGAFTQILLDRGLGAAGVAIDSAPVKGLLALPVSTLKSGLPVLKNPANNHRAVALTPEEFHYAFTNTLSEDESAAVYERYAVPGPGRVLGRSDEEFEWAMHMNFFTALRATRAALAPMLDQGSGAIVNVASVNSFFQPDAGRIDYGAAKSALVNLSRSLRAHGQRDGRELRDRRRPHQDHVSGIS